MNIKVSDSYMSTTASILQLNVHTMLLYTQDVKLVVWLILVLFAVPDFDYQLH